MGKYLTPINLMSINFKKIVEIIDMFGPTELSRTLRYHNLNDHKVDEIKEHRNLRCLFYDLCLKIAALKNWQSFTCKYCPNFCLDSNSFKENSLVN